MAKNKEKEETNLAKPEPPETNALALTDEEADDMYGDSSPDGSTPLSFNHVKIIRDTAQFEVGDDEYEKVLVGHILYKHKSNQYYVGKYDPSDPSPPACYSIDGIKPSGGEDIQCSTLCCQCKNDAFGTGTDQNGEPTKGKACKNTIRFLFLPEGSILPVTITAPPTSLGKKGFLQAWLNSVMDDVAAAHTAIKKFNRKGGPVVDFWWARVELTLEKKMSDGGEASVLKIKTLDVLVPDNDENLVKVRQLFVNKKQFTEVYQNELNDLIVGETADAPVVNDEPESGYGEDDEIPV